MSESPKLGLRDKAKQKMLMSLIDSITGITGESLPPEHKVLINIIVEGGLLHKDDPEFQKFLNEQINKLAETVHNWKPSGVKTE